MKLRKLKVRNYRKFINEKEFSFVNKEGQVNDITLIIGDNGTGKTTILQAIVLILARAIRDKFNPRKLDWLGFEYRFIQTGQLSLKIEAEVEFSDVELEATQQYANKLKEINPRFTATPAKEKIVNLYFDYEKAKTYVANKNVNKRAVFYQFSGYQHAKQLAPFTRDKNKLFEKVGNIYWYTEQRTSHNITNLSNSKNLTLDDIRNFLNSAYNYHQAIKSGKRTVKEGEFDFYEKLETLYKTVFPKHSFVGPAPRFDVFEEAKAPDFFLTDGYNQYEISNMSAGERAIFPILMDFARWNINNSIIIIDEIELHIHPSLQQLLIRTLSKLGKNNQFIITSHSDYVISMFEEDQIIRL